MRSGWRGFSRWRNRQRRWPAGGGRQPATHPPALDHSTKNDGFIDPLHRPSQSVQALHRRRPAAVIFADLTLDIVAASSSPCSVRPVPANRPCSTCSAASICRTRGRFTLAASWLTALPEAERTRFRRRHIGFVFQFFNLIPTLTVAENLLLAAGVERTRRRLTSATGRWNCWITSGWATVETASRNGCPAGSNSGWPWPGRWFTPLAAAGR